ncbi:MAG: hypothetical protein JNL54_05825 [Kineosporiaceae bacterium]|nr:hypothetical protein [Kineosporiaceae bacterium]
MTEHDLHHPPRAPRRAAPDDLDDPGDLTDRGRRRRPSRVLADQRAQLEGPHPDDPEPERADAATDVPQWADAQSGPNPRPDWVITAAAAIDLDRGVLKTGKEADVHLVERSLDSDGTSRRILMAAKRYRDSEHRLFHRDAGYLEGRRVRRSRETRAMARRTQFGRDLISVQWAGAEFEALSRIWQCTASTDRDGTVRGLVPYPVQWAGRELLMEFIGEDDGTAAPRLAQLRPAPSELVDLWGQALTALGTLATEGLAHGDLSPFNVLVHQGRLVLIDLPQVVDIVVNPQGASFLARDVATMARWFTARGLPEDLCDPDHLTTELLADANLR